MVVLDKNKIKFRNFPEMVTDLAHVEFIYKGNYNSYGWIENETHEDWTYVIKNKYRIFFHQQSWTSVVDFMKDQRNYLFEHYKELNSIMKNKINTKVPDHLMEELIQVCNFCFTTRRSILFSENFSGCQSYKVDQHYKLIATLIQKQCKIMKKMW